MLKRAIVYLHTTFAEHWQNRDLVGVFGSLKEGHANVEMMRKGVVQAKHYVQIEGLWYRINARPEANPRVLDFLNKSKQDENHTRND